MVFVFYQFNQPPIFFNKVQKQNVEQSIYADDFTAIEEEYTAVFEEKKAELKTMVAAVNDEDETVVRDSKAKVMALQQRGNELREETKALVLQVDPKAETNDKDYIFMTYVMDYLPIGMVGLLFAVMFSAAMSSTASELNALASTTTIDLYKRSINKNAEETHYLKSSKWFTFLWGALAILFATTASLFENLIQAVNYLGSIFYGTILGIFVVAFYVKKIKGNAVFIAAILAEISVITIDLLNRYEMAPTWLQMGYLWYNVVGCLLVVLFGYLLQLIFRK